MFYSTHNYLMRNERYNVIIIIIIELDIVIRLKKSGFLFFHIIVTKHTHIMTLYYHHQTHPIGMHLRATLIYSLGSVCLYFNTDAHTVYTHTPTMHQWPSFYILIIKRWRENLLPLVARFPIKVCITTIMDVGWLDDNPYSAMRGFLCVMWSWWWWNHESWNSIIITGFFLLAESSAIWFEWKTNQTGIHIFIIVILCHFFRFESNEQQNTQSKYALTHTLKSFISKSIHPLFWIFFIFKSYKISDFCLDQSIQNRHYNNKHQNGMSHQMKKNWRKIGKKTEN